MKKFYAVLALALLSFGASAQQIPNSGFEDWENPFGLGEDPVGYFSTDFMNDNVTKSTDSHSDSFSVRITTTYLPNDTTILQDSLGNPIDTTVTVNTTVGMIINGSIDFTTFELVPGIPFTGQPTAIRYWVKGNVFAEDTAAVVIGLTKFNTATSTSDEIGGAFSLITGSIPGWTQMETPIMYDMAVAPDTLFVIITSTINENAHGDSEIFVDDLELVYTPTSVYEMNAFNMNVYPNPSNGLVTINGNSFLNGCTVGVTDVAGRVVSNTVATNDNVTVNIANTGLYFVTATKPNGEVVLRKKVTVQ